MLLGLASPFVLIIALAAEAAPPKPMTTGLVNPESVALNRYGRAFVSEIGEKGKNGDGRILAIDDEGKATPFATGLDDPRGVAVWNEWMFVADNDKVWRIDAKGVAKVYAAKDKFPRPPAMLNDVTVDPFGNVFVSDSGNRGDYTGSVFRITPTRANHDGHRWREDRRVAEAQRRDDGRRVVPAAHRSGTGKVYRVKIADGAAEMIADGLPGADGLAFDMYGRLFISSWGEGKVWGIDKPGDKPVLIAEGFQSAADICMDRTGKFVLVPDMKAGTVSAIPSTIPGREVDDSPLPIRGVVAFPKLKWTGWKPVAEDGKTYPLRPLLLTHAGDGSGRNFVIVQQGTIHAFPNRRRRAETKVFLDIQNKAYYSDNENEMGLLGLAFHPKYKENGEFFVYYTLKSDKLTNVISRFRVSKDDPDKADPASEEEIIRVKRPFWNHDGGTDGASGRTVSSTSRMGDGGAANDPFRNGQNLNTLLGKVLRIDVDGDEDGKKYAHAEGQSLRRQAERRSRRFGRTACATCGGWRSIAKTGELWAGEVGQNLFEEVYHHRERRQLRLEPARGVPSVRQQRRRPAAGHHRTDLGVPSRPRQVDHRRRRVSRQEVP